MRRRELLEQIAKLSSDYRLKKRWLSWKSYPLIRLVGSNCLLVNRVKPPEMPEPNWEAHVGLLLTGLLAEFVKWVPNRTWFLWRWTGSRVDTEGMDGHCIKGEDGSLFRYVPDPWDIRGDAVLVGQAALHLTWLRPLTLKNFNRLHLLKLKAEDIKRAIGDSLKVLWYVDERLELPNGDFRIQPYMRDEDSLTADLIWKGSSYRFVLVSFTEHIILLATRCNHIRTSKSWEKHPELLFKAYFDLNEALKAVPEELYLAAALTERFKSRR